MQIKLLRDGADGVGFGPFLHRQMSIANCRLMRVFTDQSAISNRKSSITPVPSPPLDSRHSFARTGAASLSSPLKSPLAKRLALRQIDRHARWRLSETVHHAFANETSDPIGCLVECAIELCRKRSVLRSLLPGPLPVQ